jgi:cardiolipin synthase
MLDSAGSVAFFRSPWADMLRNSGIEVVESLKVNLMRVFCVGWTCASTAR